VLEIRDISAYQRLGLLDLADFSRSRNMVSRREIEKAGTRFILSELLGAPFELCYTDHNKPYLKGRPEKISVSHSHDKLTVLTNTREETGVDVELLREKVLKIRHKFLNARESAFAGADIERLITIWAAKEAMYKAHGRKQVDFSRHLAVEPFSGEDLRGSLAAGGTSRQFSMKRERLGDYILVYILNEIPVGHQQA
jgi:4'-phosphopantetheinyl transferase